jgi:branched-chain amino acid transport system permease protein
VVTIVGGTGAVQGALLGGVLIGVLDTFGKSLFPEFGLFTMYLAMIVILLVRPRGLLGRKISS